MCYLVRRKFIGKRLVMGDLFKQKRKTCWCTAGDIRRCPCMVCCDCKVNQLFEEILLMVHSGQCIYACDFLHEDSNFPWKVTSFVKLFSRWILNDSWIFISGFWNLFLHLKAFCWQIWFISCHVIDHLLLLHCVTCMCS